MALLAGSCAGEVFFGKEETLNTAIPTASVKTDSEMEALLARADQFAQQGRYDLATVLWQQVIDRSSDVVFTREEWINKTLLHQYQKYRGITSDIEHTLATLPAEGLQGYRLKADGEARAILQRAGEKGREAALAEVVRRYFMSSLGDDCAFELACRKLDRFEFLPAARLLLKLRAEFPDSNIAQEEVTLRLAVANGRVGDISGAQELLAELRGTQMKSEKLRLVAEDLEAQLRKSGGESQGLAAWMMPFGNPTRSGVMPAVSAEVLSAAALGKKWEQKFDLRLPEDWPKLPFPDIDRYSAMRLRPSTRALGWNQFQGGGGRPVPEPPKPPTLIEQWSGRNLMPVGQVLVDGDRAYFKTQYYMVCADLKTGNVQWLGFRNEFPMDMASYMASRYSQYGSADASLDMEGVELFADQVNQSMTMAGELLLNFQGPPVDYLEERDLENNENLRRFGMGGMGRTRNNRLVAYEAATGKLKWLRHTDDGEFEGRLNVSFAGSAVPYGSLLLVPVHHGTALWVYALDSESGETLWRSFMANEPSDYCSPHSAVSIAVEGGDAYLASGSGLVFSMDAISGALNWAVKYQRSADVPEETGRNRFNQTQPNAAELLRGWNEDVVIPYGQSLIFAGSDFDSLAAFDRRTGDLLWESAMEPVPGEPSSRYVLGAHNGRVYVCGDNIVRCYKTDGGRMLWECPIERSYARGMLTESGVFIPQENHVLRIDLESGEMVGRIPVQTDDELVEPVGNLFSTKEGVLVFGCKRVFLLTPEAAAKVEEKKAAPAEVPVTESKEG
jgi:outer membrane protein assembly factor BamB